MTLIAVRLAVICFAFTLIAPHQVLGKSLELDIPAQPLASAIQTLNAQTGLSVLAPTDLVRGKSSPRVTGRMTADDALQALLRGSGLIAQSLGNASVVITQASEETQSVFLSDEDLIGEDIIVQGELRARNLQNTTTSVAVIRGDDLEHRSDTSIFEVFERTAGVSLGSLERIAIRGVNEAGLGGGEPVISKRIDGAVVDDGRFAFNALQSTWDLEQIEVLRGPQSTQSGRNTLAGAIEIRSKDPTYDLEFKARAQIGNGSTVNGSFAVNVPLVEDSLALRVALDREQTNGFVDNFTLMTDDYDNRGDTTLRAGLRFDPSEDVSAVFKFTRIESDSSGNGPELQGNQFPDRRVNLANVPDREVATFNAGNARLSYDISDAFSFESETTFSQSNTLTTLDLDKTGIPIGVFINDQDVQIFEQEVKLLYDTDGVKAVIGGFFALDKTDFMSDAIVPAAIFNPMLPPTLVLTTEQTITKTDTNYAIFGEAEIEVLSGLTLIAGARYDRQTTSLTQITNIVPNDPTFAGAFPSSNTGRETTYDAFLPKVGLTYEIMDDLTIGATVQRAYRAGGVSISRVTGASRVFDPEYTWNYEASLRSEWFDDRLTVNANAFYTSWRDQQVTDQVTTLTQNAGESRLFGGEIEITAQPTDDLSLFAAIGYADTEFTDFLDNGVQFAGNEFPFASKYTAALGGTYFFYDDAYIGADASYQSAAFVDVQNTASRRNDGRFLVNMQLGYEGENWSLSAYVNNLFDTDYVTFVQGTDRQGIITAGPPRTFGIVGQLNLN